MKRIISLLLILVLSLGMLSGICFAADGDMPDEVTQADAGVQVTDGKGENHYFETLSNELVRWVMVALEGPKTITVLKDLHLTDELGASSSRFLNIEGTQARWYGKNGHKHPMTIDFGGKTVTYEGTGSFAFVERYGFTMKNGTLIYKGGTESYRGFITVGTTKGVTATSAGTTLWMPEITVEDMVMINEASVGGHGITNYVHGTKLKIKDSVLWTTKGHPLTLAATDQTSLGSGKSPYEGDFVAEVTVDNCVLGSDSSYAIRGYGHAYNLTVTDSLLVSNNASGAYADETITAIIDTKGQDVAGPGEWAGEVAGRNAMGNVYIIGEDPTKVELPFEDVKEGDWFYEFVSEMYGKGIIAGQTETTFNPGGNLTYGAALKLLTVGVNGKDVGNATSGHWATNYLNEAVAAGWTSIGADKLDAPVTREAFCEIAAKAKNLTEQPTENKFTDTQNTAVLALVKAGVVSGMNETTFAPANVLTRAQISKIISLLLKL